MSGRVERWNSDLNYGYEVEDTAITIRKHGKLLGSKLHCFILLITYVTLKLAIGRLDYMQNPNLTH